MPPKNTSIEDLWRSFKEEPTDAAMEALLHVPAYVEQRYRDELQGILRDIATKGLVAGEAAVDPSAFEKAKADDPAAKYAAGYEDGYEDDYEDASVESGLPPRELNAFPGEPWRFYNIALVLLEDLYGTQDPVEALRLYLAQSRSGASGHLGQRLAYQGLLGRLWGQEAEREAIFRYVFRRSAAGEGARFDERLRLKARRLFGPDCCRFLRRHEFDFLHWLMDARKEKATLGGKLLNIITYKQLMFFLAYLYSKDERMGEIWRSTHFGAMEPICPTYEFYVERNQGPVEFVLDYYRGLDRTFFGNLLPPWVCHKDPQDFLVHEDKTPWFNARSIGAPRDYNFDFTNEVRKVYYESDTLAEPLHNLGFWFFWAPSIVYWMLHLVVFGVLDGEGPFEIHLEILYILERILFHLDALEPIYGHYSAISIHMGDSGLFAMGPYSEVEEEIDLSRGQRWFYSWEEEAAVARDLYIGRVSHFNLC